MGQFKFGNTSLSRRETIHPDLQKLVDLALEMAEEDFSIICGYRGIDEQELAFNNGKSNARFGQSKHNFYPSLAVDLAPYPIDWTDQKRFAGLAKTVNRAASELGVKIRWGGNFKSLLDLPHFELII